MTTKTSVSVNAKLLKTTKSILGTKTNRETAEEALRRIIDIKDRPDLKKLNGKFCWDVNR